MTGVQTCALPICKILGLVAGAATPLVIQYRSDLHKRKLADDLRATTIAGMAENAVTFVNNGVGTMNHRVGDAIRIGKIEIIEQLFDAKAVVQEVIVYLPYIMDDVIEKAHELGTGIKNRVAENSGAFTEGAKDKFHGFKEHVPEQWAAQLVCTILAVVLVLVVLALLYDMDKACKKVDDVRVRILGSGYSLRPGTFKGIYPQ